MVNGNAALRQWAVGRIVGLHLKPREGRARGIPKRPVPRIIVTADGVEGDFNRWRTERGAGDPDQAVLLLPEESLIALGAEGWPVRPGDLGENLLVAGLAGTGWRVGARLRIGQAVLELSKPCDPCVVLYSLPYVGLERGPRFLRTLKGRRGWFARAARGGTVTPEMPVEIE
jgi:MOSC domain-containing protein YiiM